MRRCLLACLLGIALVSSMGVSRAASGREIKLADDCEPASFNAAVGPGACVGEGRTTFDAFINELRATQRVEAWEFHPDDTHVDAGDAIIAVSEAGETHTFTRVAHFGGGFVKALNFLSGNPTPVRECAQQNADGSFKNDPNRPDVLFAAQPPNATHHFVRSGGSASTATGVGTGVPAGANLFQCCIHPWMRTEVFVRSGKQD